MIRKFRQVDVFGDGLCTGNPVAVVLDAEGLDDDALRAFSVWTNLYSYRPRHRIRSDRGRR
ncbi:PhzF family phenazine biosynthesis protein [Cryobacterium aureum]|uniref:PhzF family phenazine biosynthesis protein n=1 Tax=Cryobacterium aureum TaxID=995037 RepID=UPI00101AD2D7